MEDFSIVNEKKVTKVKKAAIRKAMKDYFETINQGKISFPAIILAEIAIFRTKAFARLDVLYESLNGMLNAV